MAARSAGAEGARGCRGQVCSTPCGNGTALPKPCQGAPCWGSPHSPRSVLMASALLSGNSLTDLPATKPEPSWQGWFSTQVWQLLSEQCMPAWHWHTVLCIAFPRIFSMRPASGQRGHGGGETMSRGASPHQAGWGQWPQGALTLFTDIMRSTVLLPGPGGLIVVTLTGDTYRVFCVIALRDQLFPCNRGW